MKLGFRKDEEKGENHVELQPVASPESEVQEVETGTPLPDLSLHEQKAYATLKRIQFLMDNSISLPFLDQKIGIDPILGLVPVLGDFSSAVISLAFVARAAPVLSRYTLLHMLCNVMVDAVVGVIPVVGDLFDMGFKANTRNLAIFEDQMNSGREARNQSDKKWLITIVVCLIVVCTVTSIVAVAFTVILVLFLTGNLEFGGSSMDPAL